MASQEEKLALTSKLVDLHFEANQAIVSGDDDAWYLAMHNLRALAWEGKEIIHRKRLAAAPAPLRKPRVFPEAPVPMRAIHDLIALGITPAQVIAALDKGDDDV